MSHTIFSSLSVILLECTIVIGLKENRWSLFHANHMETIQEPVNCSWEMDGLVGCCCFDQWNFIKFLFITLHNL